MMIKARGLLALLLTCAILLGLSTCQRVQGDSQPSSWSPSSSSSSVKSENLVYQSRGSHNNDAKSPSQQQSDSVEYYYYYDDDDESAAAANSQNDKQQQQQQQQREPKATKTDDNISSVLDNTSNNSNNNNNSGSNSNPVNGTVYEDSYYYDNDYDEEEDLQSQEENGNDEQNTQQEQQLASKENVEESPIEESVPIAEIPINQTHSEERETQQPEEKQEHTTTSSITNNTTTTTVTTTTTTTSTTTATPTTTTISSSSISPETISKEKVDTDSPSEGSILIGEAIVSVVTTKSVVNGTFSVPETTTNPPPTSTMLQESTESSTSFISSTTEPTSTSTSTTEFSPPSTILASVQTGRSVSGARFLPFASVDKVEQLDSTESIIDKLDRVQSELSSGFLANNRFIPRRYNKKPFSATSLTLPPTTTVAPTSSPISPISITSITKRPKVHTTLDDVAAFLPKDFPKSSYRTSTSAPLTKRPKFQTTLDDVDAFLPKDFPRASYKTSTTTSTTTASSSTKRPKIQTTLDDLDGFLPKDFPKSGFRGGYKRPSYKTSTTTSTSTTTTTTTAKVASTTEKNAASTRPKALTTIDDIGAFLPPGYKLKKEDATTEKSVLLSEILAKTKGISSKDSASISTTTEKTKSLQDLFAKSEVDISALLPPGYKPEASSPAPSAAKPSGDPLEELLTKSSVDISALLPSGYKPDAAKSTKSIKSEPAVQDLFAKSNVDISALLPPGFASSDNKNDETVSQQSDNAGASTKNNNGNAGGGSNSFKVVFPSRPGGRKPIHKITTPPTRGAGAVETAAPKIQKGWPIRATTEFTGWPTSSTTPISIEKLLEAARTATVSSVNVSLIPTTNEISSTSSTTTTTTTTMRPTTPGICDEDCEVAGTIKIVENATWVPELLDRNTREWQDLAEEIEREMNLVFAKSPVLRKWFRNIRIDAFSQGSVLVDYFIELSDLKEKINTQQLKVIFHDSLRTFNFDNPMEARPKGPVKLGKFTIDPKGTDFVVIPRVAAPKMSEDENRLIPQWAIAVIVIGVGGLLFIIVFGVSVLVNRQHGSKLKPSITAMYEEEVSKNVMSHAPPPSRPASEYQKNDSQTMWNDPGWHDKPFESTSHKILVDGLPYERKYNPYDSWKSEWNGYYYPPTQASGSNSNFSRHHPDYDLNF